SVFEIIQGGRGNDFGQTSNGLVLATAVVETLPGLFRGRKETTGRLARIGIVAAAAIGFGIAGVVATTNDDKGDDAMGYRLMSVGLNQAVAGGIIYRW
ncbi:MAG: hypothetical protein HYY44_09275, partial [Deltaproteobacteria bacterium]|nr:hypothetical protein [Deltaproteobacteria bacterium]